MNIKLLESFVTANKLDIDITQDLSPDDTTNVYELIIYAVKYEVEGKYKLARKFAVKAGDLSDKRLIQFASSIMFAFTEVRLDPRDDLDELFERIKHLFININRDLSRKNGTKWFNFHFFSAIYFTAFSTLAFYKMNYQDAINANLNAISHWRELGKEDGVNLIMIDLQFCYTRAGQFEKALASSDDLMRRLNCDKDQLTCCHALLSRAETFRMLGNYNQARGLLEKAYEIAQNIEIEALVFHSSRFLAKIYAKQGLYKNALKLQKQALSYFSRTNNSHFISLVWNDLGITARLQGDFKMAEKYHMRSITHSKNINMYEEMLTSYYNLILNEIASGQSSSKLKDYMHKIEEFARKIDNPRFNTDLPQICTALILKTSSRLENKFAAMAKLRDLVEKDHLYYEYKLTAVYHLLELMLLEYNFTGEEFILDEVQDTLILMYEIGTEMHSYPVLIDYYILQTKFEKERGRKRFVEKYLAEARKLAEKSGEQQIIDYITQEEDYITEELQFSDSVQNSKADQLTDFTSVSDYLRDLQVGKVPVINPDPLEPLILMINSLGGMNLFLHEFEQTFISEINLVSSFLSAMISFSQEAFKDQSRIEMIKIGSQKLALRLIEPLNICFIFRGQTHEALNRIDRFVELLTLEEELLVDLYKSSINESHTKKLTAMVEEIFGYD